MANASGVGMWLSSCSRGARVLAHFAVAIGMLVPLSCRSAMKLPDSAPVAVSVSTWAGEGLSGRRFTTDHFDIVSTLRDKRLEDALPGFLEATYRQYVKVIAPSHDGARRLTTYVFGTRREWERFAKRRFASRFPVYARIRSGGFTESDTSVSFHTSRSATLATLAHEGWHQYLGANFAAPIPAWLNEGFACYHEAVDFAAATPRFTPQRNTLRINSLRDALQRDKLIPMSEIVETDAGRIVAHNHSGVAQVYYGQAWALVTFLKYGLDGRYAPGLQRLLDHIADGTYGARSTASGVTEEGEPAESSAAKAFRTYFPTPSKALADQYRDHLMQIAGFRSAGDTTSP